ncbi:MAG: enoyl-CoA hydratase/isomerase family protein [Ilumatobacteraceae bacterium]
MSKDRPVADGDNTGDVAAHAPVSVAIENGVAHLVLSRPEKRNAVTFAMWAAIENEVSALSRNPEVRVLVVRGAGDHFCAGADISELTNGPGGEYARVNWAAEEALAAFPGPTIAVIRGNCVGGGVSIAPACALRIAASASLVGITPAKLGIVYPTNALERAVRLVGASATKHLMFTGDLIDSSRALRIGLIDEVHDGSALDARTGELISVLLERSSLTQVATKSMVDEVVRDGRVKPATTRHYEDEMDRSGEVREGVAAFLAKRPPRWPWRRI